jgi:hypothetical protein
MDDLFTYHVVSELEENYFRFKMLFLSNMLGSIIIKWVNFLYNTRSHKKKLCMPHEIIL